MGGTLPLALSLLAVAALIGLARWLGFVKQGRLADFREAEELADSLPGGFRAVATVLDQSGAGALLRDAMGRIAVVAPKGAHFIIRLVAPGWRAQIIGADVIQLSGPDSACRLTIGPAASDWLDAVLRQCESPA